MSNPEKNIAVPNYDRECDNCGQVPCVDIENENGVVEHTFDLCGVCCFGTAKALDPNDWHDLGD